MKVYIGAYTNQESSRNIQKNLRYCGYVTDAIIIDSVDDEESWKLRESLKSSGLNVEFSISPSLDYNSLFNQYYRNAILKRQKENGRYRADVQYVFDSFDLGSEGIGAVFSAASLFSADVICRKDPSIDDGEPRIITNLNTAPDISKISSSCQDVLLILEEREMNLNDLKKEIYRLKLIGMNEDESRSYLQSRNNIYKACAKLIDLKWISRETYKITRTNGKMHTNAFYRITELGQTAAVLLRKHLNDKE